MTPIGCCEFCGQIAGDVTRNAIANLISIPWSSRPVLDEVPGAVVMPSIGALVPGHVLLCPTEHARSFAATSSHFEPALATLGGATAERLFVTTGLPVHRFEHGSSTRGERVACSVEHAHLHLVPARVDIRSQLGGIGEWRDVGPSLAEVRAASEGAEYLLYESPCGERSLTTTSAGFPSQLLRRILAQAIGVEEWNWRRDRAVSNMLATAELFGVHSQMAAGAVC
jgi:ATP adenylyltransferase